MARTRIAITTPSRTSCASLYSEVLARQSESREELLCSDWLASVETALGRSMIYSQSRQNNRALFIQDSSGVQAVQAFKSECLFYLFIHLLFVFFLAQEDAFNESWCDKCAQSLRRCRSLIAEVCPKQGVETSFGYQETF